MYKVNDVIIHFRDGVSKVTGITKMGDIDYLVIQAERGTGELIYVPINKADSIIRPVMDKKLADKVLLFMKEATIELSPNTKQRRDCFKRRLSSGDPFDLGFLAKQLFLYEKQDVLGITVKFGPADLDMLRYGADILYDELALSYKVKREMVFEYIIKRMEKL